MRTELGVVAALLVAAALAWWSTAERMTGMDAGPGAALGSLGWFTGVWATMTAAMMLPSLAPAAAVFAVSVRRELSRVLLFAAGYLLVWGVAGIGAYGLFELGKRLFAGSLAWNGSGRWLAAGVLALAALYELTPPKRASLSRCRGAVPFLGNFSQSTRAGAFATGLRNGGWCLGCTWALMAALFALGVMSLAWMGLIAVLVALEKVGPWARATRLATAVVLVVLATAILTAPHDVPEFAVPRSPPSPHAMNAMGQRAKAQAGSRVPSYAVSLIPRLRRGPLFRSRPSASIQRKSPIRAAHGPDEKPLIRFSPAPHPGIPDIWALLTTGEVPRWDS
jgi:predicted metal-binding membrane protein